jgi:hypothetical protein
MGVGVVGADDKQPSVAALKELVDGRLPLVELPDLLMEVDRHYPSSLGPPVGYQYPVVVRWIRRRVKCTGSRQAPHLFLIRAILAPRGKTVKKNRCRGFSRNSNPSGRTPQPRFSDSRTLSLLAFAALCSLYQYLQRDPVVT